jgi:hypothetical protein
MAYFLDYASLFLWSDAFGFWAVRPLGGSSFVVAFAFVYA